MVYRIQNVVGLEQHVHHMQAKVTELNVHIEAEKMASQSTTRTYAGPEFTTYVNMPTGVISIPSGLSPLPRRPAHAGIVTTPKTPTFKGYHNVRQAVSTVRKSHKRTMTPTQASDAPAIDRQPCREMLAEFFKRIGKWAQDFADQHRILEPAELAALLDDSDVRLVLDGAGQASVLLADRNIRREVVAALVTRDIIKNTMSDSIMLDTRLDEVKQLETIITAIISLCSDEINAKQALLEKQTALVTTIKANIHHKQWRLNQAKLLKTSILDKLTPLVHTKYSPVHRNMPGRDWQLEDLYNTGYRIGFRMRMDTTQWVTTWPKAGADFSLKFMVNEAKMAYGSVMDTYGIIVRDPQAHCIRFALSPVVQKLRCQGGGERREVVHNAMVLVERKGVGGSVGGGV
jgi:uncharacterized protein